MTITIIPGNEKMVGNPHKDIHIYFPIPAVLKHLNLVNISQIFHGSMQMAILAIKLHVPHC